MLNHLIKSEQLPYFKKLMPEEDYNDLSHTLDTNKTGLDHIEKHIYVKMFGHKDLQDYYNAVTID